MLNKRLQKLEALQSKETIAIKSFVVDKDINGHLRKILWRTTIIKPDGSTEKIEHTKPPIEDWNVYKAVDDD